MPPRRSPAAETLHNTLVARPAGITVFVVDGIERLTFTAADVGRMFFGAPVDADEAKRQRHLIDSYYRSGLLRGRRVGKYLLFPGDAVAEFVRSLGTDTEQHLSNSSPS